MITEALMTGKQLFLKATKETRCCERIDKAVSRHSGMERSTGPQMRNCASGNLEIPGSMLRIASE